MRRLPFSSRKEYNIEESSVNLTPLIDVVFVVLIMFILIAPLIEFDRIKLANAGVKKELAPSTQKRDAITIHVYADNVIHVNGKPSSLSALLPHLKRIKHNHPHMTTVKLFHDKEAFFGTYQEIKNSVETAGFDTMDVILHSR